MDEAAALQFSNGEVVEAPCAAVERVEASHGVCEQRGHVLVPTDGTEVVEAAADRGARAGVVLARASCSSSVPATARRRKLSWRSKTSSHTRASMVAAFMCTGAPHVPAECRRRQM
jgi:hypothetical protein